ncbi:hypothetical protein DL93DRAFT_2231925 [Clavulina sp. PMI_390]|nr:hypothetical protein DL93DRAFT_2231925 [Clavulina sp. PMI_390]
MLFITILTGTLANIWHSVAVDWRKPVGVLQPVRLAVLAGDQADSILSSQILHHISSARQETSHLSAPIMHTLPSELVVNTLLLVCEGLDRDKGPDHLEAFQSRLHVSQVCSSWRELVMSTSRLWANITWFTKVYCHVDNQSTNVTPKQIDGLLYALIVFLERSSDHPIDLWVSPTGVFPRRLPVWDVIEPHLHRCRSLKIMSYIPLSRADHGHVFPLRGQFPYLTHLRIEQMDISRVFQSDDAAPHLSHLSLDESVILEDIRENPQKVLRLAFTSEMERQYPFASPYWDAVDRALVRHTPCRHPSPSSGPDLSSSQRSDALVLRVRCRKPRVWLEVLPCLQHLIIAGTKVSSILLFDIGRLPHLKTLTFLRCSFVALSTVETQLFPALEHLVFHECEDLHSLNDLRRNVTNFPMLRRFTSRFSLRWKGPWKDRWATILPEVLCARPDLVFEWFYRTTDGQSSRPPWIADVSGDVAERLVELDEDKVDEFDWVDLDRTKAC